jgi:hypothetical protein
VTGEHGLLNSLQQLQADQPGNRAQPTKAEIIPLHG